jgi:uncharacterized protein YbbK (DUF523 family)
VITEQAGRLRLGVSACLLGNEVRYDGGHKRHPFLTDLLAPFVEWVPVCPEVEAGFGTPREAMHLVRDRGAADDAVRLLTVRTRRDVTRQLARAVTARLRQLASLDLDGYVLKKDSPSCGLFRVKVYGESGTGERTGRGLFAAGLADAQPLLPLEEEGRLSDARLRENFIERVFAYRRLRELTAGSAVKAGDLMRFHARHKLLLLAHVPTAYARLGRLVASAKGRVSRALLEEYATAFMDALAPCRPRAAATSTCCSTWPATSMRPIRDRAASSPRRSTTTDVVWCRWWSRSRSSPTTRAGVTCAT